MAILSFQKPDKVVMLEANDFRGTFEFRPLEPGYGITIGNALRRVLLSSLEGFAITSVRIEGVDHEFSSLPGVVEDMTDIILKLKQIRFRRQIEEFETEKVAFDLVGQTVLKAGDLNNYLNGFQVLNPDLEICHMESTTELKIELTIEKGRGYVPADENKKPGDPIGVISVDSIHTPIKNVKYEVSDYRVEQRTDYEKLTFDIETDGSIHPKEALKEAARICKRVLFVTYIMNEYSVIRYAFMDQNYTQVKDKLDETYRIDDPDALFFQARIEDMDELNRICGLKLLCRFASDGPSDYIRSQLNAMDDETFAAYLNFHQKTCERKDLLGASSHVVDILTK